MSAPQKLTLSGRRRPRRRRWGPRLAVRAAGGLLLAAIIVVGARVTTSTPQLHPSAVALARITLPAGGGTVTEVAATGGREAQIIPVKVVGQEIWPTRPLPTGERVTLDVTVTRPGWNAWLAGSRQRVRLTITTPRAVLKSSYVTVGRGQDVVLRYSEPVALFGNGVGIQAPKTHPLAPARSSISFKPGAGAGSLEVAAAPRDWEIPQRQTVSWFPAGSAATAVAVPNPGTSIKSGSPIRLTFSKTVGVALANRMPMVSPAGSGNWRALNSHTIEFVPSGYGYGLGATVQIALPSGVRLIGGTGDPVGTWKVSTASTLRLQQLLASLGYLPVSWTPSGTPVADDIGAQEAAAVTAPPGTFTWRYPNTPVALKRQWQVGVDGEVTKAAVMSFENANGLAVDGIAGPTVWRALIAAAIKHEDSTFGYTFVVVREANAGETESTWHDGRTVASGVVNTGTRAAGGTTPGVFAVYEHLRSTTMSGTNPDGSKYSDPGIPWVSYFNGGDALHGFLRAAYGFPQSDGCVEMPYAEAGQVWPYTPIGTVVDVSTAVGG